MQLSGLRPGQLPIPSARELRLLVMIAKACSFITSMLPTRELDDEAIKAELTRFKGVGAKTVACVLMFCLERPEFPVDVHVRGATHVWQ